MYVFQSSGVRVRVRIVLPNLFKLKSPLTSSQSENTIDSISRHKGHAHFKLKIPLTASQGAKTTSIESHERHQARRLNANMSSTS